MAVAHVGIISVDGHVKAPWADYRAYLDQQIGGLIMWVPAGTIYAGISLALLMFWIAPPESRDRERRPAVRADARAC